MNTVLLIILLLLLIGGFPMWGLHPYGWAPSEGVGFVLLVLLILAAVGRI